jgi:hypothetical protein
MDTSEFRRARELAAWLILLAAAVLVVAGAWQFLGLPGPGSGAVLAPGGLSIGERGAAAVSSLASIDVTLLPVAAVLLAMLPGRPVPTARRAVQAAVIIQGIALGLAFIGWGAGLTTLGGWYPITAAADLVIAAAGLVLTIAVLRSRFIRQAG